jgi:hypothetical protein
MPTIHRSAYWIPASAGMTVERTETP